MSGGYIEQRVGRLVDSGNRCEQGKCDAALDAEKWRKAAHGTEQLRVAAVAWRDRFRDVARLLAVDGRSDEGLLPHDVELDYLFAAGYLANERDITDEYVTRLTREGEEFVRRVMREPGPPAPESTPTPGSAQQGGTDV